MATLSLSLAYASSLVTLNSSVDSVDGQPSVSSTNSKQPRYQLLSYRTLPKETAQPQTTTFNGAFLTRVAHLFTDEICLDDSFGAHGSRRVRVEIISRIKAISVRVGLECYPHPTFRIMAFGQRVQLHDELPVHQNVVVLPSISLCTICALGDMTAHRYVPRPVDIYLAKPTSQNDLRSKEESMVNVRTLHAEWICARCRAIRADSVLIFQLYSLKSGGALILGDYGESDV
ncbi:hypothetical protein BKA66DRAFT_443155 [Pyrenochaeta sp. MPI-SDFR-AT-0127]|nr:hypothetical protein BKA66DRAFT_443155 [Pyrenochaeta sp. MPI-SDFR-AT-0127]